MSLTPALQPDLIYTSGNPNPVGPCPNCGFLPHQAPEGVNALGEPHWTNSTCFKCGFRPGINQAVNQQVMAQAFEDFKRYVAANVPNNALGIAPPANAAEVEALKAELAAVNAKIASDNQTS